MSDHTHLTPVSAGGTSNCSIDANIFNCCCTINPLTNIYVTPEGLCQYINRVAFDFKNDMLVRTNSRFVLNHYQAKLYTCPVDSTTIDVPTCEPHYIMYKGAPYALRVIDRECFTGVNLITFKEETFYLIPDENGVYYVDEIFSADEEIQKAGLRVTPEKYAKVKAEELNDVNLRRR